MSLKRASYGVGLTLWMVLAGGSAVAGNAYEGQDFSTNYNGNTNLKACDRESDGNAVYARASHQKAYPVRTVYKDTGNDPDGSGLNACGAFQGFEINEHWTIERVNNWPDRFGDIHPH